MGHGRWPDQLWTEPRGYLSPGRHLRRTDPQRREASRSAAPAADDIRASRQSQARQGARPDGAAVDPRPRRRGHRMRRRSLLLRLQPGREIVERDAQSRSELGERGEAAGLAPRFDLAQIARRNPGGGSERLAGETAMGAPNADRMLAGAEASDQLARKISGAR